MMILFVIIFLVICLFICYICYKKYKHLKYLKNIPGPTPNFFFGNVVDFIGVPRHEYINMGTNFVKKYGSIFKVIMGPYTQAVCVSDLKFIEYILKSNTHIDKSINYHLLKSWIGTGLLTGTGIKWKKHRKMLTPAFHFSILENFIKIFDEVGNIFIKKLEQEVGKKSVELTSLTSLCTLDAICEATMGLKLEAQQAKNLDYVYAVKTMLKVFVFRTVYCVTDLMYPFTPYYYKEKRAIKTLNDYTDKILYKKLNERLTNPGFTKTTKPVFIDILLESTIDGQPLSANDIKEEINTFMFAGHDTTSHAISFTLYCLANNPEVQKKAFEEQKLIFGEFKDDEITADHLQQMKYLEMVIKESLRMYPPVPVLGRCLNEEIEYEGNIYPKGLNIVIMLYTLHRDEKHFPDPEQFRPERFDESNAIIPFSYCPFSLGPRNCIGQKFAMLEMKSILSKVLKNFELVPAEPNDLILIPEVVLTGLNGINIGLKKRVY